jgi:DMSO reductase family type II enzyme chaperone
MTNLTDSAGARTRLPQSRSRLFQLIALGFAHPLPEFHHVLTDGSYIEALNNSAADAVACDTVLPFAQCSFIDFEADYIHLFQMGRGGKPVIALTAGDHKELNKEQGRPEFLLQYTAWYKHFGLKIDENEGANELPDHLVCQLEFMSWLSHLEDTAEDNGALQRGYRSAQRDFLQRHLQPFLELLVTELQRAADRPRSNPIHLALAALALEVTDTLLQQFDAALENSNQTTTSGDPDQIAAVNLWG